MHTHVSAEPEPDILPAAPPPALRVGVAGARQLPAAHTARIAAALHEILGQIHALLHTAGGARLRLLSALARGADRHAAEAALALGYGLFVPMPFPREEYERDFTGSETPAEPHLTAAQDLAAFRRLFAAAHGWIALDGRHDAEADRAYEATGRFIVRHCDVLIAVWDDEVGARGRGGTLDTMRYAANAGVPVFLIHAAADRPPRLITDPHELFSPQADPQDAGAALAAYLTALLAPPPPPRPHRQSGIGWVARLGQRHETSPMTSFLTERRPRAHWLWSLHALFLRAASGVATGWRSPVAPARFDARYWYARFTQADDRAGDYAARYRSSYVWIVLLGTVALTLGALISELKVHQAPPSLVRAIIAADALTLLAIPLFVLATIRFGWHERFIEYRLLAELCRKQQALSYVGWTITSVRVRHVAADDRAGWVAWLFAAYQRAAPLPRGELREVLNQEAWEAIIGGLVDEQLAYHTQRARTMERAKSRFSRLGGLCFIGVLLCTALKMIETWQHFRPATMLAVDLTATLLPSVSAVLAGIGAYAELQVLAGQSRQMVAELTEARARLEKLRSHAANSLISQTLGNRAAAIATLMLQDLDGWARLFRVKVIEPG